MATSPTSVQRHLRGISYPAELEDLVAQAEENDAPADVLAVIETLEERAYEGPDDIARALGAEEDE